MVRVRSLPLARSARALGFGHFVSAPKARKFLSPGQRPGIGWQNPCGLKGRDSLPETNAAILIPSPDSPGAGRLWGVLGESVISRNRRHLHQKPGKAPSEDDISRRIPALSGTPSGRLRRALCLGLRICTGPSGRESLLDSSPRPLAWAERSRALGAEKNGQTPEAVKTDCSIGTGQGNATA